MTELLSRVPNHIITAMDAELVQKAGMPARLKTLAWIILILILAGSALLRENLFLSLPLTGKALLIAVLLIAFSTKTEAWEPTPMEIRFYDDCMVIYHERIWLTPQVTRKTWDILRYQDALTCQYNPVTTRMDFIGMVRGVWYNYRRDGSLPDQPDYDKTTDSIRYFYARFSPEIDFVGEIEAHSPLRIAVKTR